MNREGVFQLLGHDFARKGRRPHARSVTPPVAVARDELTMGAFARLCPEGVGSG